jgi:hypothetical protein
VRVFCGVIGFFIAAIVAGAYMFVQYHFVPLSDDPVLAEWRSEQVRLDCTGIMFLLGFTFSGWILRAIGNDADAQEAETQTKQFKPVFNFVGGAMLAGNRAIGFSRGVELGPLDYALFSLGLVAFIVAGYRVWQLGKWSTEYDRTHVL